MKLSMEQIRDYEEEPEEEYLESIEELEDFEQMVKDSLKPIPLTWNTFKRKYGGI